MPEHIFNKKDPIVVGVTIVEGTLRIHTPISVIKDGEVCEHLVNKSSELTISESVSRKSDKYRG